MGLMRRGRTPKFPRAMTEQTTPKSHAFQAEVAELLNLMVHSVYSETDIFLRELISNASDACDKLRYEAIAKPELLAGDERLAIRLTPDAKAGTLAIADNGIGMTQQELIDNLGTIARSGTKAFLQGLAEAKDGTGPDRQVRRRLLFGVHGRRPDRGHQPPRRLGRDLGLALRGRRRASSWRRRARSRRRGCRAAPRC